ncbi:MAG: NUDIX hydrolase [Oscillospiraceae bacterium]|nr:NUDIX hydrolase [Oscillospiraceae bacterium]
MEIWDAYNSRFEMIDGMTLIRGEESSIPKGIYHLVCNVIVRHIDGTYLLMQRDPRKSYPMMWEATAGGSALKGETPTDCAVRELYEETGINVSASELTELNRRVCDETRCVYFDYLCTTDCDKDSIIIQEGETVAYKWSCPDDMSKMPDSELLLKIKGMPVRA